MNVYHMQSIVDRWISPPSKFAGLPQSALKTSVLSYGVIKQIFTQNFINHMLL